MARDLKLTITAEGSQAIRVLKQIDDALDKTGTTAKSSSAATDQFQEVLGRMGQRLLAVFAVERLVAFTHSVVDLATSISNLSAQTGISTDAIQRWKTVGEKFGVDVTAIAMAVDQMGRRLAGGDQSATDAVRVLGLSVKDLLAQAPDQAFLKIASAIGAVESPAQRSNLAFALLGRTGQTLLPILNKELPDALAHTGRVMGTDTVKALHDFDVATKELSSNLKVLAAEGLGGIAQGLNLVIENFTKGEHVWTQLNLLVASMPLIGNRGSAQAFQTALANQMAGAPHQQGDITLPAGGSSGGDTKTSADLAGNLLKGYTADALKPLTTEQEHFLEQLYDINKLTTENAQLLGVSADQMEIFKNKEDAIITAQVQTAAKLKENIALYQQIERDAVKATDAVTKKWLENRDAISAANRELGQQALDALNARGRPTASPTGSAGFDQALASRDMAYSQIAAKEATAPGVNIQGVDVYSAMRAKAEADFDDAIAHLSSGAASAGSALGGIAPSVSAAEAAFASFTGLMLGPFAVANGSVGVPSENNIGTPRGNNIGVPSVGPRSYGLSSSTTAGMFASGGTGSLFGDVHIYGTIDSTDRVNQIATAVMRRLKQQSNSAQAG